MQRRAMAMAAAMMAAALAGDGVAEAQTVGSFRWQQQPYCNVIQLTVVQQGSLYRVDGFDDQCGAPTRAAVTGLALPNPNGSIGFGLTVVTAPNAAPVHISASIAFPALSGTWSSASESGQWTFVPGAGLGGPPRSPAPTGPPTGGFSVGGGVISNLGAPLAGGDATNKAYVDAQDQADRTFTTAQNVADRAYADAQDTGVRSFATAQDAALRSYVDTQNAADRGYADTQNLADRAYTRTVAATPMPVGTYGAHVVSGITNAVGCTGADIDTGLNVYQPLAVPEGATLTGVRVTYVRGVTGGSLIITVRSTEFVSGSAVTTTHATHTVVPFGGVYVTETVPLTTPLVMNGTKRVTMQFQAGSSSTFCGATPVFTLP